MSSSSKRRTPLNRTAYIDVYPNWLGTRTTSLLMERLRGELAWERQSITLFGKPVLQPRLISWAGTAAYRYSGLTLPARAEPPCLLDVSRQIRELLQVPFNHVLLNRYRDGLDHMGWHADDEASLGPEPVVACLSLGASRALAFKPRSGRGGNALVVELSGGDLLVMAGTLQHDFVHSLPKRKRVSEERISLTYRWLRH